MNGSINGKMYFNRPKKSSLIKFFTAIMLLGFVVTSQAGKITSVPSVTVPGIQDGFGGWNFDNVEVVLNGATSTFDELNGAYSFSADSDFTYAGHVFDDDVSTTLMGYTLAKDWPVGEPAGIKIVNDDFDVKEGKPTNCIMSTSYLEDHFLDSANPVQVPCSGPFQSHKRYKLAMLPATIDGAGTESVELVFNVEVDGTTRDYQVFQKINNWTDERLEGFTIEVGTGVGANFVPASDIGGVGLANLSVSVPDTIWNAKQLANFSSGLFGPEDLKHDRPAGYFDPVDPAGFFIEEFPNVSGATDTLTAINTLGSDYADLPAGALAAANQFGPWLPNNMLPYGIFFDDDGNPSTDAELIAWYGWNPNLVLPTLGWMEGAAGNFAEIPDAEIINKGENLAYTMGVIDDLVNVGLNYVVTIGDVSAFPGGAFTIRITPTKDTSGTLDPTYVAAGVPVPSLKFTSSNGVVSLEPSPLFNIGDLLTARVGDADLNTDPLVAEEVVVNISSTEGINQSLTLIEQGEDRGVFAQVLPAEYSDVVVGAAVTVTVTYVDVDDGLGGVDVVKTATTSTNIIAPAGILQFNPVIYSVEENDGNIVVTVERTDGTAGEVTVEYQTISGTAIGGVDFVPDTGTLTFADTVASQTITVVLLNDVVVEADKDFTILLSNATNGATILDGADTATITITDSDVAPPPSSSSSGCSCTYNPDGSVDPLLPALVFASLIYLGWRSKKSDV